MPNAHNGYYDTTLEMGYVGLALLVTFICATLHAIGRVADRDPVRGWLSLSLCFFVMISNGLESTWMRGFEFLWVMFVILAVDAARYWQPDRRGGRVTARATTCRRPSTAGEPIEAGSGWPHLPRSGSRTCDCGSGARWCRARGGIGMGQHAAPGVDCSCGCIGPSGALAAKLHTRWTSHCSNVPCGYVQIRLEMIGQMAASHRGVPAYLVIGDSLTEIGQWRTMCGREPVAAGISGARSDTWLPHAKAIADALRPEFIVLALGTNDVLTQGRLGPYEQLVSSLSGYRLVAVPVHEMPSAPQEPSARPTAGSGTPWNGRRRRSWP